MEAKQFPSNGLGLHFVPPLLGKGVDNVILARPTSDNLDVNEPRQGGGLQPLQGFHLTTDLPQAGTGCKAALAVPGRQADTALATHTGLPHSLPAWNKECHQDRCYNKRNVLPFSSCL